MSEAVTQLGLVSARRAVNGRIDTDKFAGRRAGGCVLFVEKVAPGKAEVETAVGDTVDIDTHVAHPVSRQLHTRECECISPVILEVEHYVSREWHRRKFIAGAGRNTFFRPQSERNLTVRDVRRQRIGQVEAAGAQIEILTAEAQQQIARERYLEIETHARH